MLLEWLRRGVSEMMGEGWTRKDLGRRGWCVNVKRGVVEFVFLWFC